MTRTQDGVSQDIIWEIDYDVVTAQVDEVKQSTEPSLLTLAYTGEQYTIELDPATTQAKTHYNVQTDLLVSTITDAKGGTRTLEWTEDGTRQLESITETVSGDEVKTTYAYDTDTGYVETEITPITDSLKAKTTYTYDTNNDLESIVRTVDGTSDPAGPPVDYTFNGSRERTSMTIDDTVGGLDLTTDYTYSSKHQLETEEAPDGTVTKHEYDSHGNRTAVVQNYVSGQSATSSRNVRTEYAFDGSTAAGKAGLMTSETDPLGRVTAYEYDDLGRLTMTIRNQDGGSSESDANRTSETLYDEIGWVEATTDERGTVTRLITDTFGRTTERIEHCTDTGSTPSTSPRLCDGDGDHDSKTNIVTTQVYDDAGNMTSQTLEGTTDVVTEYEYDDLGRQTTMTLDPTGLALSTEFAYDEAGNEIAVADPRGSVTRSFYDKAGNLIETIENCSSSAKVLPDPIESCSGNGTANAVWNRSTTYVYDDHGRLETETAPNGRKTTSKYDTASRLEKRIDNDVSGTPSGNEDLATTYAYDEMGRTTAVRSPTWGRTAFTVTGTMYDALGRVTKSIDRCTDSGTTVPGANVACTGAGTQDVVTNHETAFTYDAAGNQVSMTTPSPAAPASGSGWLDTVITRYAYDGADRLCRVLENAGTDLQSLTDPCATAVTGTTSSDLSTVYEYDEAGNLTDMTDASGEDQSYTYDRMGRMTSRTDGLDGTITWAHDERGNRLTQSDRERAPAISVTWAYDPADRVTSRTADSATVDYTYDDIGGLISADGPSGEIAITRNRLGDPTLVEPDDGSTDTTYGYGLMVGSRTDASGDYDFSLDEWGRELEIEAPIDTSSPFEFAWRPDGGRKERIDPNGMVHDHSYSGGRLGDIVSDGSGCSGASCADIEYTYNRAGMRLSEDSSIDGDPANGTAAFEYDAVGRLVDYDAPGSYADEEYGWSEVLDRESLKNGGTTVTTTFDAAHRPTSDTGGGSYSHDDDGRLTAQPGQVLEWDSLGRLTTVKDGSNNVLSGYTYDALDRLREVTSSGTTIRHRYVGTTTQVSQTRNVTTSSNIRKFVHSWSGELLARFTTPSTGRRYYGINGHGDITWTAKGDESVHKTVRYDPWGQAIATSGGSTDFGFQGSWVDPATDLYWVIARWYAPSLGRFISEDGLLGEPVNPLSRHLYAYGWGDPVGMEDMDWWLVGREGLKSARGCSDIGNEPCPTPSELQVAPRVWS